jgi:hypothetical protein
LTPRKTVFVEKSRVKSPEMPPRFSGVGFPGEVNTMENCTGCNEGLATLSGEVEVRFIALISLFDRAQDPVCGEKAGSGHLKSHLDSAV